MTAVSGCKWGNSQTLIGYDLEIALLGSHKLIHCQHQGSAQVRSSAQGCISWPSLLFSVLCGRILVTVMFFPVSNHHVVEWFTEMHRTNAFVCFIYSRRNSNLKITPLLLSWLYSFLPTVRWCFIFSQEKDEKDKSANSSRGKRLPACHLSRGNSFCIGVMFYWFFCSVRITYLSSSSREIWVLLTCSVWITLVLIQAK